MLRGRGCEEVAQRFNQDKIRWHQSPTRLEGRGFARASLHAAAGKDAALPHDFPGVRRCATPPYPTPATIVHADGVLKATGG